MSISLFPKPPLEPYLFIRAAYTASLALGDQQETAKQVLTHRAGRTKAVLGRMSQVKAVENEGEEGGAVTEGFLEEATFEKNPE